MRYTVTDHGALMAQIEALQEGKNAHVSVLGESLLGKTIPLISLGNGSRCVLFVGAHRGTDWIVSAVLMDFVCDYLRALSAKKTEYGCPMEYLFETRRILILPMLNPDGVEYVLHGPGAQNPLRERVLRINGAKSEELSHWQGNARGVLLERNYSTSFLPPSSKAMETDYGGEYPESEPETAALSGLLRMCGDHLLGAVSLGTQGERIVCSCADHLTAKTMAAGRTLSRLTGYRLLGPEGGREQGGFAAFCTAALHRPAYEIKCGKGEIPLPPSDRALIYAKLRRALFSFPFFL